jgi:shikimate dehydrogenase
MKSEKPTTQAKSYKSELVGVFGFPVAENPTIVMMEAGFRAAGLDWRYLTLEVPPERLAAALDGLRAFGMRGVNLTIPHKVAVLEHLDEIAEDAAPSIPSFVVGIRSGAKTRMAKAS